MARTTVIADGSETAQDTDKVVPIPVGKDPIYVVCTFDTPDGGVRQTAIPLPRFTVGSGTNAGKARWASPGGKYGSVCDSRKDLPTTGFIGSVASSTWVRHSETFAFVPEEQTVRDDGTVTSPGVSVPEGVTVTVRIPGTNDTPDTLETLRLVNWVRQALNGRQTGIRSRLALVALAGTAKRDNTTPAKGSANHNDGWRYRGSFRHPQAHQVGSDF
jgi:hypothetical protein